MHNPKLRRTSGWRSSLTSLVLTAALGIGLAIVGATIALRSGSRQQASANDDVIASVALLVPDERLDPRLTAMEMQGAAWTHAVESFDAALFAVADNNRRLTNAQLTLVDLSAELDSVRAEHADVAAEMTTVDKRLAEVEEILQERALAVYVNAGADPLAALDDPSVVTDAARSAELGQRLEEIQISTREELLLEREEAGAIATGLVARAVELDLAISSTRSVIDETAAAIGPLAQAVADAAEGVRAARWNATIPGSDLSVVALNAYLNAETLLSDAMPTCNAQWWMIAGVARIESRHGRFGGRTLRADGRVDRPIIGIALDGGPGVLAVHDSDDGEFDADTEWDRAVGPLQFIPETWIRRGRDGNGDNYADPQNIYDAAYSAGRYLCALGGNLANRANLRSAYFGYNNSSEYVADVIGHADRYREIVLPDAPPPPADVDEPVDNADEAGD